MATNAHPMRDHNKDSSYYRSYSFDFARIKNPLTEQMKDPKNIRETFTGMKAIPYAGTNQYTADNLLRVLNRMRSISKTLGACWFSIKSFALGSKIDLVPRVDPDFDFGDEKEPIELVQKMAFKTEVLDKIKYGAGGAKQTAEHCFDDHFDNGNYFIELVLSETGDVKGALVDYHHSETVRKLVVEDGVPKVAISESWEYDYLRRNPARVIPLAPNFLKSSDGTTRAMIHCKYGNYRHYGRPVFMAAFTDCFRQYQDGDYLVRLSDNMYVGQGILEYEGDDQEFENGEDNNGITGDTEPNLIDKIDQNFTNKGKKAQSMLVMERPKGSQPFKFEQVKSNLNENFYEKQGASQAKAIYEILGWSERLLGNNVGGAFAADSFLSELKIKDRGVLRFYREKSIEGLNKALEYIDKFLTGGKYIGISFAFKPLFPGEDDLKTDEAKKVLETIGIGVRAGVITPTKQLEDYVRTLVRLPEMSEEAIKAWADDKNVRRPITLKGQDDINNEALVNKRKLEDE